MKGTSKADIKKIAIQIENLSKDVQGKVDSNGDYVAVASRLFAEATTMVFALGELAAAEERKRQFATRNYKRDVRGRFASKV